MPTPLLHRLAADGASLLGSPLYELHPDLGARDVVLEVSDGYGVVARCAGGGAGEHVKAQAWGAACGLLAASG